MLPIPPRTRRIAVAITLALALSGAAAACGSDDDGGSAGTTTTLTSDADGPTDADDTESPGGEGEPDAPSTDVGDADRQDYIDALAASAADDDFATPEQSECVAEGWVDTIGVDELRAAGVSPQEFADGDDAQLEVLGLDDDDAGALYDVLGDCGLDLRDLYLSSFSEEGDLTADQMACVEDIISEDAVRSAFVADLIGDDTAEDPFESVATCFM